MLMCCSLLVWAQNTVTGTVLDESNLEVIGANVKEKGTANGAITDMNGVFHLKVSNLQKASSVKTGMLATALAVMTS